MNVDLCQFNSVYIIEEVLVKYIFTLHITVPVQSKWIFWSITYTAVKSSLALGGDENVVSCL